MSDALGKALARVAATTGATDSGRVVSDVRPAVRDLIHTCLTRDPTNRPTAAVVASRLLTLLPAPPPELSVMALGMW